jgi:hypothetical protein
MDSNAYDRIIKSLCHNTGIADWHAVARSGHVLLGERVVGLVHDADDSESHELSVYVQFDTVYPVETPDMFRHLLCANLTQAQNLKGYFGLHPDTGSAVYCMRLEMDTAQRDADLPELLRDQADAAAHWLEALSTQQSRV